MCLPILSRLLVGEKGFVAVSLKIYSFFQFSFSALKVRFEKAWIGFKILNFVFLFIQICTDISNKIEKGGPLQNVA